jgi:predicted GNAT family N-acyltransferase
MGEDVGDALSHTPIPPHSHSACSKASASRSNRPEIRLARSAEEFEPALRVRVQVFVHEQGGPPEDEPDEWDDRARQYLVLDGGEVVGTARLYEPHPGTAKLGRIALVPSYRGRGWGAYLMRFLLDEAAALGMREVVLHAQTYACAFYERFGFEAEGEEFMEGGLPHRRMRLSLTS